MLMTKERAITPLGEKMLEIMQGGEWITRRQLAEKLGRPGTLPAHDIKILDGLADAGYIEKEKHYIGTVQFEIRYRAKG